MLNIEGEKRKRELGLRFQVDMDVSSAESADEANLKYL